MRQYIVNLTNNLIAKHAFDEHYEKCGEGRFWAHEFVRDASLILECSDVKDMSPETLGRIMASFDVGDIMESRDGLLDRIAFAGDCESLLRDLVATCLAYVIQDRLDPRCKERGVPQWRKRTRVMNRV